MLLIHEGLGGYPYTRMTQLGVVSLLQRDDRTANPEECTLSYLVTSRSVLGAEYRKIGIACQIQTGFSKMASFKESSASSLPDLAA